MSHTLEIPDSLYAVLKDAAEASGLTPVNWIAAHLPPAHQPEELKAGESGGLRTLADLFHGRVGRVRSGGKESLSENCGAKFADYLEEKRRAGHL